MVPETVAGPRHVRGAGKTVGLPQKPICMTQVFQPYSFWLPHASGMHQPLLSCLALIQTSPEEVGLVPVGKLVMLVAVMSPDDRFMAWPPMTAVVGVAPPLTGEMEPVESSTLPFRCMTQQ